MLSYKDFTKYFGSNLFDQDFQSFLAKSFTDLTEYNILDTDYIISEDFGMDLGFTNNDAVYDDDQGIVFESGRPVFSHFNIYPKSSKLIDTFPFDVSFNYVRSLIMTKAGIPTQTKEGHADLLNTSFLVDNYKINNIIITFDYDPNKQTINFIQVRDNDLVKSLRL
jgi:hypothetical protein